MESFVCVRLVQANALDLELFQFDYELTFAALFMNTDKTIYGRYGTRSSAEHADRDMALEGFAEAMRGALRLHGAYPDNLKFLKGKQPRPSKEKTPDDFPQLRGRYTGKINYEANTAKSCMHCHQIRDAQLAAYRESGQPIPDNLLFAFPPPAVLGLELDPKTRGNVAAVTPESVAAAAGIQAGDQLLSLDGQAMLSIADVQWVLHHAPKTARLPALFSRDGRTMRTTLVLSDGWRRTTGFRWRVSTWSYRRGGLGGMLLEALDNETRKRHELANDQMGLRVKHLGQYGAHALAKRSGFRRDDILISFDGKRDNLTESDLLVYTMQKVKPGARIKVGVLRGGKRIDLELPMQR